MAFIAFNCTLIREEKRTMAPDLYVNAASEGPIKYIDVLRRRNVDDNDDEGFAVFLFHLLFIPLFLIFVVLIHHPFIHFTTVSSFPFLLLFLLLERSFLALVSTLLCALFRILLPLRFFTNILRSLIILMATNNSSGSSNNNYNNSHNFYSKSIQVSTTPSTVKSNECELWKRSLFLSSSLSMLFAITSFFLSE